MGEYNRAFQPTPVRGHSSVRRKNRMSGSPLTEFYLIAIGTLRRRNRYKVIMIMTFRVQLKLRLNPTAWADPVGPLGLTRQ